MPRLPLRRFAAVLFAGLGLGACTVSSPFDKRVATNQWPSSVLVAVTEVTLKTEGNNRDLFFDHVAKIDTALKTNQDLLAQSKRMEPLGDKAWTITVWRDKESMQAFVRSDVHRTAMKAAEDTYWDARFVNYEKSDPQLALSWDVALTALEDKGRQYYE
ncbi:MAG: hypothetical protein ACPGOY_11060 [Rhodospirillaceae bacterium]